MLIMEDSSSSTSWASSRESSIRLATGPVGVMVASMAGPDTQAGGLIVLEYPGWMLLMSSMSVTMFLAWVVGGGLSFLRDQASGTTWSFPGMWSGVNLYGSSLTFWLRILGLSMLPSSLSEKIDMRGL